MVISAFTWNVEFNFCIGNSSFPPQEFNLKNTLRINMCIQPLKEPRSEAQPSKSSLSQNAGALGKQEMQVSGQGELEVHLFYWHCSRLLCLCSNSSYVYCSLLFFPTYSSAGRRWKIFEGCLGKCSFLGNLCTVSLWLHSYTMLNLKPFIYS